MSRAFAGRLARHHRVDGGIEERALQPLEQSVERLARRGRGNVAPWRAASCAAAASSSGVHFRTNLRAVMLLCGPELIQNSFV